MKQLPLLLLFISGTVQAEVMDKEPSLFSIWCWAIVTAVLLFAAARFRPWLLLVLASFPMLFFCNQLSEVTDPFIGPAILQEAGATYIASSWAAPVVTVGGAIAGWRLRKQRITSQQGTPADTKKRRV